MNNKFISNSVNFIFAFCWLIFFSVFAFEIFNSFFGRPAYYISNPANILKHRQIYFAIVIAYGIAFAFLYRSFFFKQATLAKRAGLPFPLPWLAAAGTMCIIFWNSTGTKTLKRKIRSKFNPFRQKRLFGAFVVFIHFLRPLFTGNWMLWYRDNTATRLWSWANR